MKVRQTCNLGVQWIKFSMHSEKYVHFTFHKVDSNYIVVLSVHVHMSESIVLCQCSCHILILWGTYSSCPSFLFLEQSLFSFSRKSKNKECVSLSTSQIVFTVQRTGVCLDVCFLKGLGNWMHTCTPCGTSPSFTNFHLFLEILIPYIFPVSTQKLLAALKCKFVELHITNVQCKQRRITNRHRVTRKSRISWKVSFLLTQKKRGIQNMNCGFVGKVKMRNSNYIWQCIVSVHSINRDRGWFSAPGHCSGNSHSVGHTHHSQGSIKRGLWWGNCWNVVLVTSVDPESHF